MPSMTSSRPPATPRVDVNVLANDTDVDGDALTVTGSTDGAHGTVACTGAGVCTYTPATGYSGPNSFTYTVSDGHGGTATGTVTVTVSASTLVAHARAADGLEPARDGTHGHGHPDEWRRAARRYLRLLLRDDRSSCRHDRERRDRRRGQGDLQLYRDDRRNGHPAGLGDAWAPNRSTSNDVTKTWLGDHTLTVGILGSGSVTQRPGRYRMPADMRRLVHRRGQRHPHAARSAGIHVPRMERRLHGYGSVRRDARRRPVRHGQVQRPGLRRATRASPPPRGSISSTRRPPW